MTQLVLRNLPRVLSLFQGQLRDPDSYVHEAAIAGLAGMADTCPTQVIPMLVKEYEDDSHSVDVRAKIAEAIVRACERCGDTLPVYSPIILPSLLRGCEDACAQVRISSLSVIGSVMELLGPAGYELIQDIVSMAVHLLQMEKEVEVRRGAAFLLSHTLLGTQEGLLDLISESLLQRMQIALETAKSEDVDGVVRHHCTLAITQYFIIRQHVAMRASKEEEKYSFLKII